MHFSTVNRLIDAGSNQFSSRARARRRLAFARVGAARFSYPLRADRGKELRRPSAAYSRSAVKSIQSKIKRARHTVKI